MYLYVANPLSRVIWIAPSFDKLIFVLLTSAILRMLKIGSTGQVQPRSSLPATFCAKINSPPCVLASPKINFKLPPSVFARNVGCSLLAPAWKLKRCTAATVGSSSTSYLTPRNLTVFIFSLMIS